jgi:hypothetical protein
MSKISKYFIVSPSFDINIGGIVILYFLCHLLNTLNHRAYMVPIKRYRKYFGKNTFNWHTPVELDYNEYQKSDSILLYPEIVDNNPKNAKNVVRWLLHKPGFHTGRFSYAKEDLIVAHAKEFGNNLFDIDDKHLLKIRYTMTDIYQNYNKPKIKYCHSFRKTKNINKIYHPEDSICIDNKSHQEISEIFNMSHTFICYDPYTYFLRYAALCGCNSIVIPPENLSKKDWINNIEDTYGIAYGFDDIECAISTRKLLPDIINKETQNNLDMITNFIGVCENHFY